MKPDRGKRKNYCCNAFEYIMFAFPIKDPAKVTIVQRVTLLNFVGINVRTRIILKSNVFIKC